MLDGEFVGLSTGREMSLAARDLVFLHADSNDLGVRFLGHLFGGIVEYVWHFESSHDLWLLRRLRLLSTHLSAQRGDQGSLLAGRIHHASHGGLLDTRRHGASRDMLGKTGD